MRQVAAMPRTHVTTLDRMLQLQMMNMQEQALEIDPERLPEVRGEYRAYATLQALTAGILSGTYNPNQGQEEDD
jgi:hypothetical protein